jgi:hypothetical protein
MPKYKCTVCNTVTNCPTLPSEFQNAFPNPCMKCLTNDNKKAGKLEELKQYETLVKVEDEE